MADSARPAAESVRGGDIFEFSAAGLVGEGACLTLVPAASADGHNEGWQWIDPSGDYQWTDSSGSSSARRRAVAMVSSGCWRPSVSASLR